MYIITNSAGNGNVLCGFTGIDNIIGGYRIKGNTGTWWYRIHTVGFSVRGRGTIPCCISYGNTGFYTGISSKIAASNGYAKGIIFLY